MALDKVSSARLKKRLPRGFLNKVQAKLATRNHYVTKAWVSYVLTGKYTDRKVLRALIRVAEEHEAALTRDRLLARGKVRLTRTIKPKA